MPLSHNKPMGGRNVITGSHNYRRKLKKQFQCVSKNLNHDLLTVATMFSVSFISYQFYGNFMEYRIISQLTYKQLLRRWHNAGRAPKIERKGGSVACRNLSDCSVLAKTGACGFHSATESGQRAMSLRS